MMRWHDLWRFVLDDDVLLLPRRLAASSVEDSLDQQFSIDELKCYKLPFGLLGFISHILTYGTLVALWYGRKPLWPFKKISNTRLDLALGFIGLSLCICMSIATIISCKNTWPLLVIAVWKLSMSLLNGLTALHVAILVVGKPEDHVVQSKQTAWWILLYVPGMAAGMTGLMNLVTRTGQFLPDLVKLTIAFYFIVGAGVIVSIITISVMLYRGEGAPLKVVATGFIATAVSFLVLSALFSDWALGIMMDNLLGVPSGDHSAFYWTYFIAKRLTMFSW